MDSTLTGPLRTSRSTLKSLAPLALANGVTVSTLYWGQAVIPRAAADFGPSATVSLMPGASLFGYAAGVAVLASLARDLTTPQGLSWQFALLVAALCSAASAPFPLVLTLSCFLIGFGCALTQRLLTVATSSVAPERRAVTIGWIIAAGLCGIVLARAIVPSASVLLGWRTMFFIDAALAMISGVAATAVAARVFRHGQAALRAKAPSAGALWWSEPTLRRAALQQAVVFAGFNLGWAVFPHLLGNTSPWSSLLMGLIALAGAAAALISGRACGRWGSNRVANAGLAAMISGSIAIALGSEIPVCVYLAMGALDSGTQIALVANQARAQALAVTPAMRGRLAAIVTTVGFAGGAFGSAIGNLLVTRL